jgi:hypothetical protein
MANMRFFIRLASNEITTDWYQALTIAKSTTIIIAELTVMSSLGSS